MPKTLPKTSTQHVHFPVTLPKITYLYFRFWVHFGRVLGSWFWARGVAIWAVLCLNNMLWQACICIKSNENRLKTTWVMVLGKFWAKLWAQFWAAILFWADFGLGVCGHFGLILGSFWARCGCSFWAASNKFRVNNLDWECHCFFCSRVKLRGDVGQGRGPGGRGGPGGGRPGTPEGQAVAQRVGGRVPAPGVPAKVAGGRHADHLGSDPGVWGASRRSPC